MTRRELGAHYTPSTLADRLVRIAFSHSGLGSRELPRRVCDPSCGAGSILLSLADELVARGATPTEVITERLLGCDIDPSAVEAARSTLSAWAVAHGAVDAPEPRIVQADALALPPGFPEVDIVVGNPPFASPLRAEVNRRRGANASSTRARAYTDDAALHLAAALDIAAPGAVVCLLQPQSVLASRDAAPVRQAAEQDAELVALWASAADHFEEASVRVCAPVLRRRRAQRAPGGPGDPVVDRAGNVAVYWEDGPARLVDPPESASWSTLLARAAGTPRVLTAPVGHGGSAPSAIGGLARCTAGFREEFYALASTAREAGCSRAERADRADRQYHLVTSGMIDPGRLYWGAGSWRLAGEHYTAPIVDAADLQAVSARVARWSAARAVPKVMIASQTKVIEAAVDPLGTCVPVTPVVSVEPSAGCSAAALAAMLSAPSNSALLAETAAGTGLSTGALRVGASAVARLAISHDPARWIDAEALWVSFEQAARAVSTPAEWFELGASLDRLVGFEGREEIITWWVERLPRRIVAGVHGSN